MIVIAPLFGIAQVRMFSKYFFQQNIVVILNFQMVYYFGIAEYFMGIDKNATAAAPQTALPLKDQVNKD